MTECDYISAVHRAIAKRDRIIQREGDADGARLAPEYLEALIWEELLSDASTRAFGGAVLCNA